MSPRAFAALVALTLAASLPTAAAAQQPAAAPNDTALTLPIQPVRTLRFTTDEAEAILGRNAARFYNLPEQRS